MGSARKLHEFSTYEEYNDFIKEQQFEIEENKRLEKQAAVRKVQKLKSLKLLSVLGFISVSMFSIALMANSSVFEAQFNNSMLKSDIREIKVQISDMKTQLEDSKILKNVESVAIQELGMQYPSQDQIVYLNSDWNYQVSRK